MLGTGNVSKRTSFLACLLPHLTREVAQICLEYLKIWIEYVQAVSAKEYLETRCFEKVTLVDESDLRPTVTWGQGETLVEYQTQKITIPRGYWQFRKAWITQDRIFWTHVSSGILILSSQSLTNTLPSKVHCRVHLNHTWPPLVSWEQGEILLPPFFLVATSSRFKVFDMTSGKRIATFDYKEPPAQGTIPILLSRRKQFLIGHSENLFLYSIILPSC